MYLHLTFFKIDRKNTVFDCRKEKLLSIFIRNLIDIIGPCLKNIRKLSEKLSFIRNYLKTDEICDKILILPCIISLLVGALYNIVDQIFIANASYLGSYGNAANTVVFR